jgi:hypothetical protein
MTLSHLLVVVCHLGLALGFSSAGSSWDGAVRHAEAARPACFAASCAAQAKTESGRLADFVAQQWPISAMVETARSAGSDAQAVWRWVHPAAAGPTCCRMPAKAPPKPTGAARFLRRMCT